MVGALDATGGPAHVERLAGVLFHVGAFDRHLVAGPVDLELDAPVVGDRLVVLADLVVLRHVRVEVLLAGEAAPLGDLAAQGQADADGRLDGLAVDDRQGAGQAEADRADVGVGLAAELGGAAAPHLRGGAEFDVHLQAEDDVEALHRLVVVHESVAAALVLDAHLVASSLFMAVPGSSGARRQKSAVPASRSSAAPTR